MSDIWLRFRDDLKNPTFQIRNTFSLDGIRIVSEEKREFVRERGKAFLQEALASYAGEIAQAVKREAKSDKIEKLSAEFAMMSYLMITEFMGIPDSVLDDATIECALDSSVGNLAMHLSLPSNPLDPRIMMFSVEVDMFLAEQRELQAATNNAIGTQAWVIDELINLFALLIERMAKTSGLHNLLVGFVMSVRQDVAPSISLAMAGRPDASYAIARRALEIVGFARIIAEDPTASEIWAFSHDDEVSWQAFKDRFSIKKLFPKGDAFWKSVFDRYDALAKLHHPNPQSFTRMEWNPLGDGRLKVTARQAQYRPEEAAKNAGEVWAVASIYSLCLAAFEYALRGLVDCTDLRPRIAEIGNTLDRYRDEVLGG